MLGQAALAMWWNIVPAMREEFEHWHSHEHFAERLALPGFLRATRWADTDGGDGFFVLYELDRHEALHSPEYLARLNAPSDWSRRMMPHHRDMVRCQSRVIASAGAAVSAHAFTLRFGAKHGESTRLQQHLVHIVQSLPRDRGLAGAHFLHTEAAPVAATAEQALRGNADRAADWIVVVNGYELAQLHSLAAAVLSPQSLEAAGACTGVAVGFHSLRLSVARAERLA